MKPGAVISGLAAATAASITGLLVFETWALATGNKPITGYVRDEEKGHPQIGALSLALVTLLVGHFEGH